jgi:hypothetical protein
MLKTTRTMEMILKGSKRRTKGKRKGDEEDNHEEKKTQKREI